MERAKSPVSSSYRRHFSSTAAVLQDEKRYRPCLKDEPLFCNRHKEKLTRAGISYIFHKYAESARIAEPELFPEKVYPHIFRHSRAMHWLEAGIDLQYIKKRD